MAYWSYKDIAAFTYNSTDLKAYLAEGFTVKFGAVLEDFKPVGAAWPTPIDSGGRTCDPITANFMYDGSAGGPAAKCALGTSSTLTITHGTGQSITGTFIVSGVEMEVAQDRVNRLVVTLTPSGTVTTDFAE